ncbi:clostripain-related cysteine peptidase [Ralstonia sp. UBA689]|uniref:clostripain-related cysteine peptidase n=1 Tax=Ralstonia sp. UBA689 TaxID=1947373 RepID=UPI0025FB5FAA|nr:clostripain-related cysteine peptidase [Ralstonia sp. UBA689]
MAATTNTNANHNPAAQGTTLMVYMVGSDLESNPDLRAGTRNLNEMLKAAAAANVNVVIETGGANVADATTIVKTWRSVKRHALKNGQLQALADIGAQNMGASQTLTDFITWAAKSYPAANYRLVLWDHGAGWKGFGLDENQTTQNSMTVPQMTAGVDGGARAAGIRFDVIGFDACLMATAEVEAALAPDADYLLASEELEPGSGWDGRSRSKTRVRAPRSSVVRLSTALLPSSSRARMAPWIAALARCLRPPTPLHR